MRANVNLFGTKADLANLLGDLGVTNIKVRFQFNMGTPASVDVDVPATAFAQNFGQAVAVTQWTAPAGGGKVKVDVSRSIRMMLIVEATNNDNSASRQCAPARSEAGPDSAGDHQRSRSAMTPRSTMPI